MNVEELRAAIGRNADRYLRRFERIAASDGGWVPGWNSAVFVHSTAWFCYRRMYGWAFLNLFAPFLLLFGVVFVGGWLAPGANLDRALVVVAAAYLLAVFVVVPVCADAIYFQRIRAGRCKPPSIWTALGAAGCVIAWMALVIAMLLPAYGDYTPRAKVSEAILSSSSIRNEITEFYREQRRLPNEQEAIRFRADQPTRWVERIVYEPQGRRLVVTLREIFPGKRFALLAREEEGELRWNCRSIDLDQKYLPSACRE